MKNKINLNLFLSVSFVSNIIIFLSLVIAWGTQKFYFPFEWIGFSILWRAFLYLGAFGVLYFGALYWLCLLFVTLGNRLPQVGGLISRLSRDHQSLRFITAYFLITISMMLLAIPFAMTRAHLLLTVILQLEFAGQLVTLLVAVGTAYGFVWGLAEQFSGETEPPIQPQTRERV